MTGNDEIRFYWRPGCWFCAKLRRRLDRANVVYRAINIWEDPDAAAQVRAVAGGNETVPTVIIGSRAMVNPSLREVLAARSGDTANPAGKPRGALTSLLAGLWKGRR
ncbi:Glutaredoxin [Amycolatopsis marina]|uniref:Glutaredoxin n=1 Tax=Amycolatopsis marina TaxID=490629 RepID=A0A1I1BIG9_9PSEU|nr:glutaredoxin domain-containing protein [Amycolatopsis marina]SFB50169.1 Glutaredoxin [Amycolatopsis marina]